MATPAPASTPVDPAAVAPSRPIGPPKKWKMWVLTCCAIYPVITTFGYILQAVAGNLPVYAHFLILVPTAVALLIFFVMPTLTKLFRAWLVR